jgi:DNA-binding LytR/AlgR family response regulator
VKHLTPNIAIVDDLEADCKHIADYIGQYFSERHQKQVRTAVFSSAEQFLKYYRKGVFQIIFLDICMGEINGLELAKRLRTSDQSINIVFMSSVRDYVFDTFSVKPDGYLCKPFEYAAFAEIVDMILARYSLTDRTVKLKLPRSEAVVQLSEIISIIACDHVAEVKLITGEYYESRTLFKELEATFENESNFLLCNRGVLINMDYAVKAKEGKIVMQNGSEYPIRRRDCKAITAKFTKYTAERMRRSFVL